MQLQQSHVQLHKAALVLVDAPKQKGNLQDYCRVFGQNTEKHIRGLNLVKNSQTQQGECVEFQTLSQHRAQQQDPS